jgi:hypothetical protein
MPGSTGTLPARQPPGWAGAAGTGRGPEQGAALGLFSSRLAGPTARARPDSASCSRRCCCGGTAPAPGLTVYTYLVYLTVIGITLPYLFSACARLTRSTPGSRPWSGQRQAWCPVT